MDCKAQAGAVLDDLAQLVGLPSLELDEQDSCYLSFDDNTIVCFEPDARTGDLVMWSMLGQIAPEDPALPREMLNANFAGRGTRGATLSLEAGTAVLSLRLPLEGLRAAGLEQRLRDFVTTAEEWSARIARPAASAGQQNDFALVLPDSAIRI